jgi:hypothetical protein
MVAVPQSGMTERSNAAGGGKHGRKALEVVAIDSSK